MEEDLLGVEFHDGDVERIELRGDGSLLIGFSHVFGVVREANGGLGGWSFSAELRVDGLRAISMDVAGDLPLFGPNAAVPATIWNGAVSGEGVRYDSVLPACIVVTVATLDLTFAPLGANLRVRGEKLTFCVRDRKRRLEDVAKWP